MEDDADDADALIRELRRGGLEPHWRRVDTAAAFRDALTANEWELLICELDGGAFGAEGALSILEELDLDVPFVVVSMAEAEDVAAEIARAGAGDYVLRSDLTRLVPTVSRGLREAAQRRLRRQAEEDLVRAEARFRQIGASINEVFWMREAAAVRLLYASPAFERVFGIPVETVYEDGERWLDVIHPEDRERVEPIIRSVTRPYEVEYRVVRPDGSVRWLWSRATPVSESGGEQAHVVGVTDDITERKLAQEELVARVRQQQAVAQLAVRAVDSDDFDQLLAAAATQVAWTLGVDHVAVLELRPGGRELALRAAVGWPAESIGDVIPAGLSSQAGYTLASNGPVVVADLDGEHRFDVPPAVLEGGLRSSASVVVGGRATPWGVLSVHVSAPRTFLPNDVSFLQGVAGILASAAARADMLAELERTSEERRRLLDALVTAEEDERARVARELHDGVGQVLTSLTLFASDLEQGMEDDAQRARVAALREHVATAVRDMRRLVWTLRPVELDDLGLDAALRRLVSEAGDRPDVHVALSVELGGRRIDPSVAVTIFRVIQEALTNAQRHGGASTISVVVDTTPETIRAIVEDDGAGFGAGDVSDGFGLLGMRERAALAGGHVLIETERDEGTTVRLEVPFA